MNFFYIFNKFIDQWLPAYWLSSTSSEVIEIVWKMSKFSDFYQMLHMQIKRPEWLNSCSWGLYVNSFKTSRKETTIVWWALYTRCCPCLVLCSSCKEVVFYQFHLAGNKQQSQRVQVYLDEGHPTHKWLIYNLNGGFLLIEMVWEVLG